VNSFGSVTHWYASTNKIIEHSTLQLNNDFEISCTPIPDLLKTFMRNFGQVRLVE
jgi:hypothetical protein